MQFSGSPTKPTAKIWCRKWSLYWDCLLACQGTREIRREQTEDPELKIRRVSLDNCDRSWIYDAKRGAVSFPPALDSKEAQLVVLVVPKFYITEVLQKHHDSELSGHYADEKNLQRIARWYN